jgi:hypothetical protein
LYCVPKKHKKYWSTLLLSDRQQNVAEASTILRQQKIN